MSHPCCNICQACKNQAYPDELTVTIAGVVGDGWCWDCPNANGVWVLQKDGDCRQWDWGTGYIQSMQDYIGRFTGVNMCTCGFTQKTLVIGLKIFWNHYGIHGRRMIGVNIGNSGECLSVYFELLEDNQSDPFECVAFSNFVVPYNGPAGLYCGGSIHASCIVDA